MDFEIEESKTWEQLRNCVNQNYDYDNDWEQTIVLFQKRIKRKYLDPVQLIIDRRTLKGEGFAIVTVQCALIEMFAAFRAGKVFNHKANDLSPGYEYKYSQQMFVSLLNNAKIFENVFWHKDDNGKTRINHPFNADDFYKNVRCGLMHEARTKENWYITATPNEITVKTCSFFLTREGGKIKIYRTVLHYRLKTYLEDYGNELRNPSDEGRELRRFFARKMDDLFDYPRNHGYEWWNS